MKRLTRPTVDVDVTAAKYMAVTGSIPADLRSMNDRLLDLVINGPTLNGVNKDVLRQLIRQLYAALKPYEDTGYGPDEISDLALSKATAETIVSQYEQLEKEGRLVVLPCKPGDTLFRIDLYPQDTEKVVTPFVVDNIVICEDGEVLLKYDSYDGVICTLESLVNGTRYLDFYRTFLTREEAERALEGGQNDADT